MLKSGKGNVEKIFGDFGVGKCLKNVKCFQHEKLLKIKGRREISTFGSAYYYCY
jgi:hypothetical protein